MSMGGTDVVEVCPKDQRRGLWGVQRLMEIERGIERERETDRQIEKRNRQTERGREVGCDKS